MEKPQSALFTDFYELTMAQGYFLKNMNRKAVFEMFFRKHPFQGGFSILAGVDTLLEKLESLRFFPEDIAYLRSLKANGKQMFTDAFLDFLTDFRFRGDVYAMDEGTVIFPQEPLVRVEGGLIEAQIVEGLLLNTVNFQSLIATKTARVWLAANKGSVMEFGLRRAQGPDGSLSAARAAYIGGACGTSSVEAARIFGIKPMGTMAHSWVMSFPSEEEAFAAYAELYPDFPVFLVDTYDTLKSGIVHAANVGKKLKEKGINFGVRLDSGDMQYLTTQMRAYLDKEGLPDAQISVSNDLDEDIISTLTAAGAPINSWGVGTRMVTGGDEAAFTGVYKMAAYENKAGKLQPSMKVSNTPEKTTNPGVKQVWRIKDKAGMDMADVMALEDCADGPDKITKGRSYTFWHPSADWRHFTCPVDAEPVPLLKKRMEAGNATQPVSSLDALRANTQAELASLDGTYKRLLNPHVYKVSATERLRDMKLSLIKSYLG
jgi:nicotinate phosphoribosyltransferase